MAAENNGGTLGTKISADFLFWNIHFFLEVIFPCGRYW